MPITTPKTILIRNAFEFKEIFEDQTRPDLLPAKGEHVYATIELSQELILSPFNARTFMQAVSYVLASGLCPPNLILTLSPTLAFLEIAKHRKLSLDLTPLANPDISHIYPQFFTLDLTELNLKSVEVFADVIAAGRYPNNFTLNLSNNPLGSTGLNKFAEALRIGWNGPYGLRLILTNTLQSNDRLAQIAVAKCFAQLLSKKFFPRGLSLDLDLGWDPEFKSLHVHELIQAAIETQSSMDLTQRMLNGITTGNKFSKESIEQRIEEAKKIAAIYNRQLEEVSRLAEIRRVEERSRGVTKKQSDPLFFSFCDVPPPQVSPIKHLEERLMSRNKRFESAALEMDFKRCQSAMMRMSEIFKGYFIEQVQLEFAAKQERQAEMATFELLPRVVDDPQPIPQPVHQQGLISRLSTMPIMSTIQGISGGIPGIPKFAMPSRQSFPGVPKMSDLTGAMTRFGSYFGRTPKP